MNFFCTFYAILCSRRPQNQLYYSPTTFLNSHAYFFFFFLVPSRTWWHVEINLTDMVLALWGPPRQVKRRAPGLKGAHPQLLEVLSSCPVEPMPTYCQMFFPKKILYTFTNGKGADWSTNIFYKVLFIRNKTNLKVLGQFLDHQHKWQNKTPSCKFINGCGALTLKWQVFLSYFISVAEIALKLCI